MYTYTALAEVVAVVVFVEVAGATPKFVNVSRLVATVDLEEAGG
jgi:hypothetical protein